jgi:hypothetical protein
MTMPRAHRKTVARDTAQIALLAPWVAGARVMTAMANLQRGRIDPIETTRMWTEKGAALAETWMKTNAALMRFAMSPFATTKPSVLDEIAGAMTAPARRRVVGNARRLAKKRRR